MHIVNKKAGYEYEVIETLEVGIALNGVEAKSFYDGRVILNGSFVRVLSGEMYLVNAKFTASTVQAEETSRSRKLLANKREILSWDQKVHEKKLTIIPLEMYTRGRFIKLKLALVKSLKEFDKRHKTKARDVKRDIERSYRQKLD